MRILAMLAACCCTIASTAEPLVAVASNMAPAMQSLGADFAHSGGARPRLSFGSSGDLLRQIQQGAPFEIYVAAAPTYTEQAIAAGLGAGPSVPLATANMGVFVPAGSPLQDVTDLSAIGRLLAAGKYRRIAMANPEVAPFGVAAVQSLRTMGVWAVEKDRVVLGANAAQALQFTLAGGVDLGFIPESYALSDPVRGRGRYFAIPAGWHAPLVQSMVLLSTAGAGARAFFQYLQTAAARDILISHGYTEITDAPL